MIRFCFLGLNTVILLCLLAVPTYGQITVHVEYLKVPIHDRETFEQTVSTRVRKTNEQRLANGKIFAWYHYQVRFPLGSETECTDVVVTVFTDPGELKNRNLSAAYKSWIQRSSRFVPVADIRSEGYGGGTTYSHITVSFLDDRGKNTEFLDYLRSTVKPQLQKRIDDDTLVNWALFEEQSVGATDTTSKQYALVARYNGFGNLERALLDRHVANHLVKEQAWKLMDIVERKIDQPSQVLRQADPGFYQELSWAPHGKSVLLSVLKTADTAEGFQYEIHQLTLNPLAIKPISPGPMDLWTSWSPDGSRIVFAAKTGEESDVYVMQADGSGRKRLTDHPSSDTQPDWSPDGQRIVFVSRRDGTDRIYAMNADGTEVTQIVGTEGEAQTPRWSPGGDQITYFETTSTGVDQVVVVNVAGAGRRVLAKGIWPSWSPDGKSILFGAPEGLTLMNADGGKPKILVPGVEFGEFSPDGTRIAYIATADGFVSVNVMNVDGTERRQLITRPSPEW